MAVRRGLSPITRRPRKRRPSRARFRLTVNLLECRALLSLADRHEHQRQRAGFASRRHRYRRFSARRHQDCLRSDGLRDDRPEQRPSDDHQRPGNRRPRRGDVSRRRPGRLPRLRHRRRQLRRREPGVDQWLDDRGRPGHQRPGLPPQRWRHPRSDGRSHAQRLRAGLEPGAAGRCRGDDLPRVPGRLEHDLGEQRDPRKPQFDDRGIRHARQQRFGRQRLRQRGDDREWYVQRRTSPSTRESTRPVAASRRRKDRPSPSAAAHSTGISPAGAVASR